LGERHDEHAGFYLIDVSVPELAFRPWESGEEAGGDHVLDSYETGGGGGRVVDEALADVFVEIRAVVVCLDTSRRVGGIDMEGVKMGADGFDGLEVLGG